MNLLSNLWLYSMAGGKMYRVYPKNTSAKKGTARLTGPQRRQVKALIKAPMEHKYFENARTDSYAITSTGVIGHLSPIPQGDDDLSRDGDQLTLTSVNIRGMVTCGDNTNVVRLIFFQWRPQTTPSAADILSQGVDGSTTDVYSLYNHDKRSQFKILKDITFTLSGYGTTTSPYGPTTQRKFSFNLSKKLVKKLQYVNGSSTVGSNQFYYFGISDSTATPNPLLDMIARMNFIDA